jgi:hypothetical protein
MLVKTEMATIIKSGAQRNQNAMLNIKFMEPISLNF